MINALKKLMQGDTAIPTVGIAASAVTGTKIATSAVSALHMGASAIVEAGLKYKRNTFSFLGTASAVNGASAASGIYVIATTGKAIGMYLTKQTSHANTPLLTQGTNSITVSMSQNIVGSDVCEGVIITIEA